MLPVLLSVLGPIVGKIIDTVGSKLGVDMSSDTIKEKRMDLEKEVMTMFNQQAMKQLDLAMKQADTNIEEAKNVNRNWLTWRESLGYVCVTAVAYHFVIQQMLAFLLSSAGVTVTLPNLDISGLFTILTAMLGVHFVDSRYNSPLGQMPAINPQPAQSTGRLVTTEDGDQIWKEN